MMRSLSTAPGYVRRSPLLSSIVNRVLSGTTIRAASVSSLRGVQTSRQRPSRGHDTDIGRVAPVPPLFVPSSLSPLGETTHLRGSSRFYQHCLACFSSQASLYKNARTANKASSFPSSVSRAVAGPSASTPSSLLSVSPSLSSSSTVTSSSSSSKGQSDSGSWNQDEKRGQGTKSGHKFGLGAAFASAAAVAAAVYFYYKHIYDPPKEKTALDLAWEESTDTIIEKPVENYVHPYTKKPLYWKIGFISWRICYLLYQFIPCYFKYLLYAVFHSDDEAWRKYMIDSIMDAVTQTGCTFQKLAQWVSMRPDIFPADLCQACSTLRENAPQHSFDYTCEQIQLAFGLSHTELFDELDAAPIASGSVGQVHRGKLKKAYWLPGQQHGDVAVKVRHPNIIVETYKDLELVFMFIENFSIGAYSFPCNYDDLQNVLREQIDFNWEAYNLYKLAYNFRDDSMTTDKVGFPKVSRRFHTEGVLVETWAGGKTIASIFTDLKRGVNNVAVIDQDSSGSFSAEMKETKKVLGQTLFDMTIKMFLRDNFIHGDLHAGNLLFNAETGTVTVLDAGLVTCLKPDIEGHFGMFLRAICSGDADVAAEKLVMFDCGKHAKTRTKEDKEFMRRKINEILDKWKIDNIALDALSMKEKDKTTKANIGDVIGEIFRSLQSFNVVLRGDVAACFCTISVAEGLIMQLYPEFDMVMAALPYFMRYKGYASMEQVMKGRSAINNGNNSYNAFAEGK